MLRLLGLIFLTVGIDCGYAVKPKPLWNSTYTDLLKRDLLMNYDKYARPSHHENATNVSIRLTVRHIDINEARSTLILHGWMKMSWNDEKLKWNTSDYGNLSVLHMGDHEVWQPDVILYNSATGSSIDHYGHSHCLVYNSGLVLWVPPTQFQALCNINIKNWPYDVQKCSLTIGSWTYSGNQINLNAEETEVKFTVENPAWKIVDIKEARNERFYSCCPEPYVDITWNLTIARQSDMHGSVVFTPLVVVMLTTLASFWLPPQAGEKIALNGFNAVVLSIFMKYFSSILPALATEAPVIVCCYCTALYLVGIAIVIEIIVLKIARSCHRGAIVPSIFRNIIDGWYGYFLGLKNVSVNPRVEELKEAPFDEHIINEAHQIINSTSSKSNSVQQDIYWSLLATLIDRTAFYVYLLIFIILTLKYLA